MVDKPTASRLRLRKKETQKTTTETKEEKTMMQGDKITIKGKEAIVVNTSWTTLQYKYEQFGAVYSISLSDLKTQQTPQPQPTMSYIPHGTTYNDMLTEFTDTKYHWESRVAVIKSIKSTFKKLTTIGINELVSGYNYQLVIDALSNAKIPHCTFADWLRAYEWKTPQQSEAGIPGNTFASVEPDPTVEPTETEVFADIFEVAPEIQSSPEVEDAFLALEEELGIQDTNLEIQEAYIEVLEAKVAALEAKVKSLESKSQPGVEQVKIIDVFVAVYGKSAKAYQQMVFFMRVLYPQYDANPGQVLHRNLELQLKSYLGDLYPTSAQIRKL